MKHSIPEVMDSLHKILGVLVAVATTVWGLVGSNIEGAFGALVLGVVMLVAWRINCEASVIDASRLNQRNKNTRDIFIALHRALRRLPVLLFMLFMAICAAFSYLCQSSERLVADQIASDEFRRQKTFGEIIQRTGPSDAIVNYRTDLLSKLRRPHIITFNERIDELFPLGEVYSAIGDRVVTRISGWFLLAAGLSLVCLFSFFIGDRVFACAVDKPSR